MLINGSVQVRPIRRKTTALKMARNTPLLAAESDFLKFFSPRARESIALIPTPVPAPTAIIRFCRGNAIVTAVRAFSASIATNIESPTLYTAWTIIEIIIGTDMFTISFFTGITPILFSCIYFSSMYDMCNPFILSDLLCFVNCFITTIIIWAFE